MGTVADKERDASESSGLEDMKEIAASLGLEDDDEVASASASDDDDNLESVGAGYGGAAAAAVVSDASIDPEPAIAANAGRSASESKADAKIEAAAAKPAEDDDDEPEVAAVAAAAASTSAAALPEEKAAVKAKSEPVPVVAPAAKKPVAATVSPRASAAAPVAVSASSPPPEKKKGGFLLIGTGLAALAVILWFAMSNNDVKPHPKAAAEVRTAAATPAPEPPPEPPKKIEPVVVAPPVEEPVVEEVVPPVEEKVEVAVTSKKKRSDRPDKAGGDLGDKVMPTPEPEAKKPTQDEIDEKFRTECLLNPSKPGCDEIRKRSHETGNLDAKLADKLTASQVREGFSKVKSKAKSCGGQHGVEAGAIVRVKVSIGGSGDVLSVDAMDSFAGTPLGDCVASALKDAHFPRFTSESQGTVYPVSF